MESAWSDRLSRLTRPVNRAFLAVADVLVVAILLIVLYDIVLRDAFNDPTVWALDFSRFLLLFVFFLALAPALENGNHVAVDILDNYLPPRPQRLLRIAAVLLVLVFGSFFMWQITRSTLDVFATDDLFPTFVQVKQKYVYWIAPVGVAEFLLTALVLLGQALRPAGSR